MIQLNWNQIVRQPGQNLLLKGITWKTFETLLAEEGERRTARFSYSQGMLEIMTPLPEHEVNKIIISNLVEIILETLDQEFWCLGSTTLRNDRMTCAVEPDNCFYIQHEAVVRGKQRLVLSKDPPPDLAIEIDITSRTHFDNYEKLGIPELWRYDGKKLEINVLENGIYRISEISLHFPQLPLIDVIPYYVERSKVIGRNATMKAFREWLASVI